DDLAAAARALEGEPLRATLLNESSLVLRPLARGTGARPLLSDRAQIAFTQVLHTPRDVSAFLRQLDDARAATAIEPRAASELRRRGRLLLRGTRTLRAALRRAAHGLARSTRASRAR